MGTEEDEGEGETTLYFDAEEGTSRDEDGESVTLEMSGSEEPESQQEEGGEEGSRTPQAAGSAQPERTQTFTSMSLTSTGTESARARRPSRLRRLSSARRDE